MRILLLLFILSEEVFAAIRFDAGTDWLSRTSAVTLTSFTAMGWAQVQTDRGAATYQPIFNATAVFGTDADIELAWGNADVAGAMLISSWDGVAGSNSTTFGSKPAVGEWFFWYVKCSGTGANLVEAGWRRRGDASFTTATTTLDTGSTGTASIRINSNGFADFSNVRIAAFALYSSALSALDIEREWLSYRPNSVANLTSWVPMIRSTVADAILDFSGLGANLTSAGTLVIEDGPPISFK